MCNINVEAILQNQANYEVCQKCGGVIWGTPPFTAIQKCICPPEVEGKGGGFFDLPFKKQCNHPEHEPPKYLHIPQGKGYKHICPSCGEATTIIPTQISL